MRNSYKTLLVKVNVLRNNVYKLVCWKLNLLILSITKQFENNAKTKIKHYFKFLNLYSLYIDTEQLKIKKSKFIEISKEHIIGCHSSC